MPRYVSCVDVTNVSLGLDAAAGLTEGTGNVCLGPGAGRGLTTGSGNVILGGAPGGPADHDTIVLSTGSTGAVRARWTADGDTQLALRPSPVDPPAGFATLGYDPVTNQMGVRYHDGTAVRANHFRSDAEIAALAALTDATGANGTVTLVADAATRSLKRLVAGRNVTLDAAAQTGAVVVAAADAPLTEATAAVNTVTLVADATNRSVKRLVPGTNITLDPNSTPGAIVVHGPATSQISAAAPLSEPAGVVGGVSLIRDAPTRSLRQLVAGSNLTLTATTDAVTVSGPAPGATNLDGLTDAVAVAGTSTLALGAGAGAALSGGTQNTLVGYSSGAALTSGGSNVAAGYQAGAALTTGGSNVAVGTQALATGVSGSGNVAVGALAGRNATGGNNVFVGPSAGSLVTSGSGNVFLGGYTGVSGALSNTVVLARGSGEVVMRWDDGANAVQRLDGSGGTLGFAYAAAIAGLTATLVVGGVTSVLELSNERPVNATNLTASTFLTSAHRNRFTVCTATAAVSVYVVAYSGIVVGAEHEFFHNGSSTLTFAPQTGVTIHSTNGQLQCVAKGAVLLKYLDGGSFALIGALQ